MKNNRRLVQLFAVIALAASPVHGQEDAEPVCPLSESQTKNSIQAFETLSPIFREPRCFNCHGGVNPFEKTPKHPVTLKDYGPDDARTLEECPTCHGAFEGWQLPNPDSFFAGRSTSQICNHIKSRFGDNADTFIGHMRNDESGPAPFIDVAYAGTMGLNADGQDQVIGTWPAPPPTMPRPVMLQLSKDWVKAMGGKFHNPSECGCVELEYKLRLRLSGLWHAQPPLTGSFVFAKDVPEAEQPIIPIHFADDGSISGEATVHIAGINAVQAPNIACAGNRSDLVRAELKGQWRDAQQPADAMQPTPPPKIELQVGLNRIAGQGTETCTAAGRTGTENSNQSGGAFSFKYGLDAAVGATQTVPWSIPLPGFEGSAQVTLIRTK
jgi:hypothetical protein